MVKIEIDADSDSGYSDTELSSPTTIDALITAGHLERLTYRDYERYIESKLTRIQTELGDVYRRYRLLQGYETDPGTYVRYFSNPDDGSHFYIVYRKSALGFRTP